MADAPLARLFWRVVDDLDHLLLLVRLRIVDAVCGPEPTTPADQKRQADHEQLRRVFPEIGVDHPALRWWPRDEDAL